MPPSGNVCLSIQSIVLRRWASTSSSGLPGNSDLKCDLFNYGIYPGWIGCAGIGWAASITICTGCIGGCTGSKTGGGCSTGGAGGPPSVMFTYVLKYVVNVFFLS